jgi:hypothetical protein
MEFAEALDSLNRILHEERLRPTSSYKDDYSNFLLSLKGQPVVNTLGLQNPGIARPTVLDLRGQKKPRLVSDRPDLYSFGGGTYDLLSLLFSQVSLDIREQLIAALLNFVEAGGYSHRPNIGYHFPSHDGYVSDLPVIAEFCIRNGHTERLFEAAAKAKTPTPGLALMLMQLEETIALNFNLFSSQELRQIPTLLAPLRETADRQTHESRGTHGKMVKNLHYKSGREKEANQIIDSIDGITAECNQAIFFYLRGALQKSRSLEVESDKVKVLDYLDSLGFDPLLTSSLKKAEELYRPSSDAFELKNCLGLIRTFYEHMHRQAGAAIAGSSQTTVVDEWDPVLTFLKNTGFLSKQQDKFARGLYALLSDEGVHPLIAEREFARLLRNMVIEYGLMFLIMVDKKGIKISTSKTATGTQA